MAEEKLQADYETQLLHNEVQEMKQQVKEVVAATGDDTVPMPTAAFRSVSHANDGEGAVAWGQPWELRVTTKEEEESEDGDGESDSGENDSGESTTKIVTKPKFEIFSPTAIFGGMQTVLPNFKIGAWNEVSVIPEPSNGLIEAGSLIAQLVANKKTKAIVSFSLIWKKEEKEEDSGSGDSSGDTGGDTSTEEDDTNKTATQEIATFLGNANGYFDAWNQVQLGSINFDALWSGEGEDTNTVQIESWRVFSSKRIVEEETEDESGNKTTEKKTVTDWKIWSPMWILSDSADAVSSQGSWYPIKSSLLGKDKVICATYSKSWTIAAIDANCSSAGYSLTWDSVGWVNVEEKSAASKESTHPGEGPWTEAKTGTYKLIVPIGKFTRDSDVADDDPSVNAGSYTFEQWHTGAIVWDMYGDSTGGGVDLSEAYVNVANIGGEIWLVQGSPKTTTDDGGCSTTTYPHKILNLSSLMYATTIVDTACLSSGCSDSGCSDGTSTASEDGDNSGDGCSGCSSAFDGGKALIYTKMDLASMNTAITAEGICNVSFGGVVTTMECTTTLMKEASVSYMNSLTYSSPTSETTQGSLSGASASGKFFTTVEPAVASAETYFYVEVENANATSYTTTYQDYSVSSTSSSEGCS